MLLRSCVSRCCVGSQALLERGSGAARKRQKNKEEDIGGDDDDTGSDDDDDDDDEGGAGAGGPRRKRHKVSVDCWYINPLRFVDTVKFRLHAMRKYVWRWL